MLRCSRITLFRGMVSSSGVAARKKKFNNMHVELRKSISRRGSDQVTALGQQAAMLSSSWDEILLVLTAFWKSDVNVPLTTYKTIMQKFSSTKQWDQLEAIYQMLKQVEGYPTDNETGKMVAKMYSEVKNIEGFVAVFTEMLNTTHILEMGRMYDELVTFSYVIKKVLTQQEAQSVIELCVAISRHLLVLIRKSKYPRNIVILRLYHPLTIRMLQTIPSVEAADLCKKYQTEFQRWCIAGGGHYLDLDQTRTLPEGHPYYKK
eukprot:TRINITY_DN16610_c0_g1_i1.p1 TRINITY_DN16610_c0_g1~~TRINITY_DN16610_c0_g1_i1.p1  ORF type:complete len:262 (+),score=16.49 TRINITY_DN16610_c0_g1_i1:71-856(+)